MQKSSVILFTANEVVLIRAGSLPERIQDWGLSLEDALFIINNPGTYTVVGDSEGGTAD